MCSKAFFAMIIRMLSVSFSFFGQMSTHCEANKFSTRIEGPDGHIKLTETTSTKFFYKLMYHNSGKIKQITMVCKRIRLSFGIRNDYFTRRINNFY